MIREAVQAGRFYPASADELRATIAGFLPPDVTAAAALGVVCPHAGYRHSGALAVTTLARVKITETVILMGPSHTGQGRPLSLMAEGTWRLPGGDAEIDTALAAALLEASPHLEADVAAHLEEHSLEVQIPILQYFRPEVKIVPIIFGGADDAVLAQVGRAIAGVVRDSGREVLLLTSTDMSHYVAARVAQKLDEMAIEAIMRLDADSLLRRVRERHISMCGYLPTACLITAVRELGATAAELVGYDHSGRTTGDNEQVVGYAGLVARGHHPLVNLARRAVEAYVTSGTVLAPEQVPEMPGRAGAFVTIYKHGDLRGCIGTITPTRASVSTEVAQNALSSASRDPRFNAVRPDELPDLEYKVDVLAAPEPVADLGELDAAVYGVIVSAGARRGLLLPDLEGVDTPAQQIQICRQKGGISPDEPVTLERFRVIRYT